MLKIALLVLGASALSSTAAVLFIGRTVHSSSFQMDIPYLSAIKMTPDPANIWSWHHDFTNVSWGTNTTGEVLVDVDGNNVMDTEHPWLRVMVTDIALTNLGFNSSAVWLRDSVGKRFCAGLGGPNGTGPTQHYALATPLVLPVGSSLYVDVQGGPNVEVHLIGRVVNL